MERTTSFDHHVRQSCCVERFPIGSANALIQRYWNDGGIPIGRGRRGESVFEDEWLRQFFMLIVTERSY